MTTKIETSLIEATNEINEYCIENQWITDIKIFTTKFSRKLVLQWKSQGSFEIEENLTNVKLWIDSIKLNIEAIKTSRNKIFKIDCTQIEKILVPKLEKLFNETCEWTIVEIHIDLNNFIKLITEIIRELNTKPKSIEEFAKFSNMVNEVKSRVVEYEMKITSIKVRQKYLKYLGLLTTGGFGDIRSKFLF